VQAILDRQAAGDSNILSIDVFDITGKELFFSGFPDQRQANHAGWLSALAAAGANDLWRVQDEQALVTGTTLVNNFGRVVGGVAIRYSRSSLNRVASGVLGEIGRVGLIAFALTALAGAVSVPLLFRGTKRSFARVCSELEAVKRSPSTAEFKPDAASEIEVNCAAMQAQLSELSRRLGEARAGLIDMIESR